MITILQRMTSGICTTSVFLVGFLLAATASAQDAEICKSDDTIGYRFRLNNYWIGDCYLTDPEYQKLNQVVGQELVTAANQTARTTATLNATSTLMQATALRTDSLRPTVATLNKQLREKVRGAFNELNEWEPKSEIIREPASWGKPIWTPNSGTQGSTWEMVIDAVVDADCGSVIRNDINKEGVEDAEVARIEKCGLVYEQTLTATGVLFSMRDIDLYYYKKAREDRVSQHKLNAARWESYLGDMQFQYPWELSLNYCADNPRNDDNPKEFSRWQCFVPIWGSIAVKRHVQSRPDQGFVEPPKKRWIYLHPDIGLLYSNDQSSGNKLSPALTFQWLGRFWFEFDGGTGKIIKPFGVSLVSTIADLPDSSNHGIGIMGHYRNFSLSVTKHSSDYMVSLNLNLAGLLFNDSELVNDFIGTPDPIE